MKLTHKNFDIKSDNDNTVRVISSNEAKLDDIPKAISKSNFESNIIPIKHKEKDKCQLWTCSKAITNKLFKYIICYRHEKDLPNEFLFIVQLNKDIIITKVTTTFANNFKIINKVLNKQKEMDERELDNLIAIQKPIIKQALSRCISHNIYETADITSSTFIDIYDKLEEQYDELIIKECINQDLDNNLFNDTFLDMLKERLMFKFAYYG